MTRAATKNRALVLAVLVPSVALAWTAVACLDDLGPLPVRPVTGDEVATATACGDGIIDTLDDGGDAGESCDPGDAQAGETRAFGCDDCRFTCTGILDPAGHCYFRADPTHDYSTARGSCINAGGHVVTVSSAREAQVAAAVVDGGAYRIGLSVAGDLGGYATPRGVDEPGYPQNGASCTGCFGVFADDASTFPLRPDAGPSSCLVAGAGAGPWVQVPCEDPEGPLYETVCEREPVGRRAQFCGGPFCTTLASTAGRKRYVISLAPARADEADRFCRSYAGGSLVVFESREEREQLARELTLLVAPDPLDDVTVWIGVSTAASGAWVWDDATPVDAPDAARPSPWGNDQPVPQEGGAQQPRHAYLRIYSHFDTELAHSEAPLDPKDANPSRLFVCQRSP